MNLGFTYKKLGESSSWPRKNDCYKVEITTFDGVKYINDYMPKAEYDLIMELQKISGELPFKTIKRITDVIEKYGEYQYERGADDVHDENAGAEL